MSEHPAPRRPGPQEEGREHDSTRIRDQRALTTSEGTVWIVTAAIAAALAGGMLLALWWRLGSGLALAGAIATAVVLLVMIVVRYAVADLRARLVSLAVLFWLMVLVDLVLLLVVAVG